MGDYELSPSPAPSTSTHVREDPHYINYGDIYESPFDLKIRPEYLVDDYSNALISGQNNSVVYPDSPYLVGNRYFLNTGAKCSNNNTVYPRSVLIDNVLDSSIKKTVDSNTGLLYSFFASLRDYEQNA